jgi:hypothetical protein
MKTFCKYHTKGKLLIEHSREQGAYNILIHWGDHEIYWYRVSRRYGYFSLHILGRLILGWDIKTNEQ